MDSETVVIYREREAGANIRGLRVDRLMLSHGEGLPNQKVWRAGCCAE